MRKIILIVTILALAVPAMAIDLSNNHTFVGGLYNSGSGMQAVVGTATRIDGPIWGLVRGGIGDGEASIELPELSYWTNYKGWRFGVLASPGASWVGEEDLLTYLTAAVGFSAGYIHEVTNKGFVVYARYKEGSGEFIDGIRVGGAFVF